MNSERKCMKNLTKRRTNNCLCTMYSRYMYITCVGMYKDVHVDSSLLSACS